MMKKKVDLSGTLLELPVGGAIMFNALNTSKESVRATCSNLKRKYNVTFAVNTINKTQYCVQRKS